MYCVCWYLWLQSLDAVVGHQEDLQGPQPHEGPAVNLRQPVPAQVQQPGAVGDAGRNPDQPTRPAVHQVRGLVAEAGTGTDPEAQHGAQEQQQRTETEHRAAADGYFYHNTDINVISLNSLWADIEYSWLERIMGLNR